jgi:hypothetical protein
MAAVLPSIIAALAPKLVELIGKILPDPAAKAAATLQLMQLQQTGELKQLDADMQTALAQIGVNAVEAQSSSLFKSGWRPFVGWVCAGGLVYQFIAQPLFSWASSAFLHVAVPPILDTTTLMTTLGGLLGLGSMRTVERVSGVIPHGQ